MSGDSYQFVKETARKVIIEMGVRKVMLKPENYHLWYEYTMGANKALVRDIDALKEAGHPFTEKINRELYRRHIGKAGPEMPTPEVDVEAVRQAQEQTETLLKSLLNEVLETSSSAAAYNENLHAYSSRISEAQGIAELQGVVRDLLRDTAGMAQTSASLQGKLEQARHEAESLRRNLDEARHDALMDALTGIRNRRWLDGELGKLLDGFVAHGARFSVIMLDVDRFKAFNDAHGHPTGDEVLRRVARMLIETVADGGLPARYGGEEFSVLVPGAGLEGARYLAERVRLCISKIELVSKDTGASLPPITASLGVAEVWRGDTVESVVKRADAALYQAKQNGRNRVCTESELEPATGTKAAAALPRG